MYTNKTSLWGYFDVKSCQKIIDDISCTLMQPKYVLDIDLTVNIFSCSAVVLHVGLYRRETPFNLLQSQISVGKKTATT